MYLVNNWSLLIWIAALWYFCYIILNRWIAFCSTYVIEKKSRILGKKSKYRVKNTNSILKINFTPFWSTKREYNCIGKSKSKLHLVIVCNLLYWEQFCLPKRILLSASERKSYLCCCCAYISSVIHNSTSTVFVVQIGGSINCKLE